MLKYNKEFGVFLCPKCREHLREFEEGFIIQAFECEDCNLIFDSKGDILSEEEHKEFYDFNEDD